MNTNGTITAAIDATTTFTQFTTYDVMSTSALAYNDDQWHFLVMSRDNANDMNVYIDGQILNLSTATGQTATVDAAAQVTSIGASCSAAANCATGTNFWDGSIDDFTFSSGATTVSQLLSGPARRLYNDARPLVGKRVITVTDATTASASTIGDSGETWIPNEFSGMIVTLTGGTGAGQTRRVLSNTATTITVSSNFTVTPDTTTDFEVDPEAIYGASDIVTAIGVTAESPLGEARQMCIGTNDTADGGGVTCYNHQAGPNIIADLFHADAKQLDDFAVEWAGTDYDDIRSIDLSGRALVIGSEAHLYAETRDVRLGQGLDYLANQLFNIRGEIIQDGITLTGSLGLEVGFTGGADLAEYYYSDTPLEPGEIVALDGLVYDGVKKSTDAYQKNVLGIVATTPGLILGGQAETAYPIALVGRVPVLVTTENGMIRSGDRITASATVGHGMRATKAGRVLGTALQDLKVDDLVFCPDDSEGLTDKRCGQVMVFVNLVDYLGTPLSVLINEQKEIALAEGLTAQDALAGEADTQSIASCVDAEGNATTTDADGMCAEGYTLTEESLTVESEGLTVPVDFEKEAIAYLKAIRADNVAEIDSEVFTDRLAASFEIYTPRVVTEGLRVDRITALNEEVLFENDTVFFGTPYFTTDTAGFALVKAGASYVDVPFEREYLSKPIVNASMASKDGLSSDTSQGAAAIQAIFGDDVRFLIANATTTGFRIVLNKPAPYDVHFNWIALMVKEARTLKSDQSPAQEPPADVPSTDTPPQDPASDEPVEEEPAPPEEQNEPIPPAEEDPDPISEPFPEEDPEPEPPVEPQPEPTPETLPEDPAS